MKKKKDLYEVLGVDDKADKATIKKAYRKRAKKAHPDAGGDPAAFTALAKAHDILSDEEKRRRYDETGDADGGQTDEHCARAVLVKGMFEATRQADNLKALPLVTAIKHGIEAQGRQAKEKIHQAKEAIANVQVVIEHLSYSGEGRSHLHEVLKAQKNEIEGEIKHQKEAIRIVDLALKMLKNYEYSADTESLGYATFQLNSWMAGR